MKTVVLRVSDMSCEGCVNAVRSALSRVEGVQTADVSLTRKTARVAASGVLQNLLQRRVPQILGVYLAIGWGVLEFTDWLIDRYNLTPRLADLGLTAWACMIPTVLLLAYFHGARGQQRFTRVERVAIPANAILAIALVALVATREPAGGTQPPTEAATALDPTRIAVLYFEDESEEQDQGHLASAFTGALIDKLSEVQALDVIPRAAVKPFRDASVPLDSIARVLDAGTLVGGSVAGTKERVLVSVALIDPTSLTSIESFTLEGAIADWTDLRQELATEVANTLRERLGGEIRLRERQAETESAEALSLLEEAERVRGEAAQLEASGDSAAAARELGRADSLLARAESLDPSWVEPIVARGRIARDRALLSSLAPGNLVQGDIMTGLWHAERALALDPGNAGALELRGTLRSEISQVPKVTEPGELREAAERDLRAAVAADPFRARAWLNLSDLHRIETRFAEAKRDAERALEADPFLAEADIVVFRLYEVSLEQREMEEAARWCDEGHRRFPQDDSFVACSLFLLALPGGPEPDVRRTWALADTFLILSTRQLLERNRLISQTWAAAALARAGLADSAVAVSERARTEAEGDIAPWIDYFAANVRLRLGQKDEALALLGAFLDEVPGRKEYIASDWMFDDLWDDPRFQELVARQ